MPGHISDLRFTKDKLTIAAEYYTEFQQHFTLHTIEMYSVLELTYLNTEQSNREYHFAHPHPFVLNTRRRNFYRITGSKFNETCIS